MSLGDLFQSANPTSPLMVNPTVTSSLMTPASCVLLSITQTILTLHSPRLQLLRQSRSVPCSAFSHVYLSVMTVACVLPLNLSPIHVFYIDFSCPNTISPLFSNTNCNSVLILNRTPASRILYAPFVEPYRSYFTRFAHIHEPVRIYPRDPPYTLRCVRGELPPKILLHHLHPMPTSPTNQSHSYWCLVSVSVFERAFDHVIYDDEYPRYDVIGRCCDASNSFNVLFDKVAAYLQFKMHAYEYDSLSTHVKCDLVNQLENNLFTVNFLPPTTGHKSP
ncbi:hypothetical protein LINPERPRIM_LOCUS11501 [Linum perenne]